MGYYTQHTLTASDGLQEQYVKELSKLRGYHPEDFLGEGESVKWYDEEEDMIEMSKRYPDIVFRVDGIGEGDCDVWTHWYKNGRQQVWCLDYELPDQPPQSW